MSSPPLEDLAPRRRYKASSTPEDPTGSRITKPPPKPGFYSSSRGYYVAEAMHHVKEPAPFVAKGIGLPEPYGTSRNPMQPPDPVPIVSPPLRRSFAKDPLEPIGVPCKRPLAWTDSDDQPKASRAEPLLPLRANLPKPRSCQCHECVPRPGLPAHIEISSIGKPYSLVYACPSCTGKFIYINCKKCRANIYVCRIWNAKPPHKRSWCADCEPLREGECPVIKYVE